MVDVTFKLVRVDGDDVILEVIGGKYNSTIMKLNSKRLLALLETALSNGKMMYVETSDKIIEKNHAKQLIFK